MFKKKPQIKNLSPLRSSERRKLADQIRKDYATPDPITEPQSQETESQSTPQTQQTLTGLRNSLLPENTSSAKFTTTYGSNSSLVSGTVYVGTHPDQDERILWFQIGKDELLIPTVYTLWSNPDLVPLLYVGDVVVQKLKGGADLFAPGLIQPPRGFDPRTKQNVVVAVAGHKSDTVPRWVGKTTVNITGLKDDASGTAAHGLHWEGDELWSWSTAGKGGRNAPQELTGWPSITYGMSERFDELHVDDEDDEDDEQEEGGVSIAPETIDPPAANGHASHGDAENGKDEEIEDEDERIPTTKEVDDAFMEAFLYAVYTAKKSVPAEPHGLDFPIQPSLLISNMIQPYLRHQSTHYNIKKTSWKNTKKFIKHLDKSLILKSKDRNGGETVILDIDFDDQHIKGFQPYKLPKSKPATSDDAGPAKSVDSDQSLGQKLSLQTVYRVSSKLVPDLLPSKTAFYTAQQITTALKQYIESNPELVDESKKRFVKLDPFIANNILGSNSSADDSKILASGSIARDTLNKRVLQDQHLCIPYHLLLRNDQVYDPDHPDPALKPKSGPAPHITMTIERRGGNKVVTAVAGLENFFINPQLIRPELQKKCAGSASVAQHVGGKPGMLEVQVQGDQRETIEKEILGKRGVKPEWIDVIDKTAKKKKK